MSRYNTTDRPTAPLRMRDHALDLSARVGKQTLITATTKESQRGGYYCNVCECLLKDSLTYLDHLNGRKHQQKLGMTMKVEHVSVEEVRQHLRDLIRKSQNERLRKRQKKRKLTEESNEPIKRFECSEQEPKNEQIAPIEDE